MISSIQLTGITIIITRRFNQLIVSNYKTRIHSTQKVNRASSDKRTHRSNKTRGQVKQALTALGTMISNLRTDHKLCVFLTFPLPLSKPYCQSQGQCEMSPFSTVTNLFISNFADQIVHSTTMDILLIGHVWK